MTRFWYRWVWYWNLRFYCKPAVRYAVITKVPDGTDGNEYDELLCPQDVLVGTAAKYDKLYRIHYGAPVEVNNLIHARLPVFSPGEVLLVNRIGREIAGLQRKPDKWDVECEYFWTRRAALKRAKEVLL